MRLLLSRHSFIFSFRSEGLFADQDQNTRYEREHPHHDGANAHMKKSGDSYQDQIDRK